jgi:hypothetical protein
MEYRSGVACAKYTDVYPARGGAKKWDCENGEVLKDSVLVACLAVAGLVGVNKAASVNSVLIGHI